MSDHITVRIVQDNNIKFFVVNRLNYRIGNFICTHFGFHIKSFNIRRLNKYSVLAFKLLFLTAVSYRKLRQPPGKENLCKLAVLLAAVLILCPLLSRFLPPFIALYGLDMGRFLVSAMQLILLAWAIVLGAAMLRHYKTQRGA